MSPLSVGWQVCLGGGVNQGGLPEGGKVCATFVKAGLSGEGRRPPEEWNDPCQGSRTVAPKRAALGRPWQDHLSKPHPPGQLELQVEKPVGQAEMSHKDFVTSVPFRLSRAVLLRSWEPSTHTRRPQPWLSLHPKPSTPRPPLPSGTTCTRTRTHTRTHWGVLGARLPLSQLGFPVLRLGDDTHLLGLLEGTRTKCQTPCLIPTPS